MIVPLLAFVIAVAALVGALHAKSLPLQIILAFWAVLSTMIATLASETKVDQPPLLKPSERGKK